ncbi:winged helix-turn-helix transcriptional regulator [Streptomyces sp. NBC_00872]|uniref:winged helix-turn-helix transcriptional regulator n=1 Tax=Streptomyces sp. NBC_00872 TaxID=2903686 RepID=UPI00386D9265|nr:winged helix-turn-helix transcriptional regulator [Streptomyces sp. NBC_00872]
MGTNASHGPLIGSLCSGYGGLDLGVQVALGGRIAWHAETNPDASRHGLRPGLTDRTRLPARAHHPGPYRRRTRGRPHRPGRAEDTRLVTRTDTRFRAPYQLSASGRALGPVHRTLSEWSQAHVPLGVAAGAERIEDALRRLHLRHTTAVIQLLNTSGPMRFVHIAEGAGLDNALTYQRLNRLQLDGLVTRTGPRHGDPYTLTEAGRALGPVYAAVEQWSHPTSTAHTPAAPAATATRTHTGARTESQEIRAAAALRRTTASPGSLFSHASQPQPQVPAAVTAHSAPRRGR